MGCNIEPNITKSDSHFFGSSWDLSKNFIVRLTLTFPTILEDEGIIRP